MKSILALAVITTVILTGCTSSTTNPPPGSVSFRASKVGTYILGDTQYYTRSQTGADSSLGGYSDSLVYTGNAMVTDADGVSMDAALYTSYIAGIPADTTQLAENGGKLYSLYSLNFTIPGVSPMMMGTRWVQIGDQNNSTWTGLKDTVAGLPVKYQDLDLTVDAVFEVKGTKVGNESLTIDGATVQAMHFKVDYTIAFTINSILGAIPVAPLVIPIDYWVVEGVGIVKTTELIGTLTLGPPANQTIVIPGFTYTATKFVKAS